MPPRTPLSTHCCCYTTLTHCLPSLCLGLIGHSNHWSLLPGHYNDGRGLAGDPGGGGTVCQYCINASRGNELYFFFCTSLCGLHICICVGICTKIHRNMIVSSTQFSCQCVLRSLHHYPVSGKIRIQPDSRFNYPATNRIRPDSENPYTVHP